MRHRPLRWMVGAKAGFSRRILYAGIAAASALIGLQSACSRKQAPNVEEARPVMERSSRPSESIARRTAATGAITSRKWTATRRSERSAWTSPQRRASSSRSSRRIRGWILCFASRRAAREARRTSPSHAFKTRRSPRRTAKAALRRSRASRVPKNGNRASTSSARTGNFLGFPFALSLSKGGRRGFSASC